MDNAWMIRNDGKAFPVKVHIYGDPQGEDFDIYNCMSVCEWLYSATNHKETKEDIIKLLSIYSMTVDPDTNPVETLMSERSDYGIEYMSEEFIRSISDKLDSEAEGDEEQVEEYGWRLYDELNQEFLRARYGGMYDTERGSKEMYFRISSVGFNWFNIIWGFVYDNQSRVQTVTVVRDEESTGAHEQYYYKSMDVHEFLTLKGKPVVESLTRTIAVSPISPAGKMLSSLGEGNSISQILESLPMNNTRAMRLYRELNLWECAKRE